MDIIIWFTLRLQRRGTGSMGGDTGRLWPRGFLPGLLDEPESFSFCFELLLHLCQLFSTADHSVFWWLLPLYRQTLVAINFPQKVETHSATWNIMVCFGKCNAMFLIMLFLLFILLSLGWKCWSEWNIVRDIGHTDMTFCTDIYGPERTLHVLKCCWLLSKQDKMLNVT